MVKEYLIKGDTLKDIADAIRFKSGETGGIAVSEMDDKIKSILSGGGVDLPELANEGSASDLISGKQLIDGDGNIVTGNIPTKASSDLTVGGATVTVPSGYYATQATKSVATGSAKTPATTITKNPTISVDSSGKITASVSGTQNVTPTVTAGYVSSGTAGTITVSGSATKQLTTQAAKTITPSTSSQTAVASGVYTTGAITVGAIPSTYVQPSTTKGATTYTPTTSNQTIAAGTYCSGTQTIKGDSNLVAGNIKSGVSIFGVSGSYTGSGGSSSGGTGETCEFTATIASSSGTLPANISVNYLDSNNKPTGYSANTASSSEPIVTTVSVLKGSLVVITIPLGTINNMDGAAINVVGDCVVASSGVMGYPLFASSIPILVNGKSSVSITAIV